MSDQGDLAKRWNAPSDDTDANSPADVPTGPMPKVEPADESDDGAPVWSDPAWSASAESASAQPASESSAWNPSPLDSALDSAGWDSPRWDSAESAAAEWGPADTMSDEYRPTETMPDEYRPTEMKPDEYAPEPVEPKEEPPPGRLVFPRAKDPEPRDDFTGTAAAEPSAAEAAGSDFTAPQAAGAHWAGPQAAASRSATPGFVRPETAASEGRTEFSTPASSGWEGSLFDGSADAEPGDERYAPVMPTGPSTPPKPGTPSSGNLRLPDWMREQGGDGPGPATDLGEDRYDTEKGGSRIALFAGLGLLVVALVASAGVYFLKSSGDSEPSPSATKGGGRPATGPRPPQPHNKVQLPAEKALRRFPGTPSKVAAQFTDAHAGLSYPRFGSPWQLPTKQNKLGQLGWSGQQIVVTERHGTQLWYGQLLSGTLNPAEMNTYGGPGTEQQAAVTFARSVEARFYGFQHMSQPFASQPLMVDGHKGWLVSSYLRYRRPGVRATGELVVTAVIDTGRKSPAVLFMAVPNTHRKLWADVSYFLGNLHVVS